ncbi:hypothetical protein RhiirA4_460563 [Rhizophagus irregularis]|uniref:Uncharacterized protein n=1 Tax=Rhizophagus irregularis TaxID=588596 RepID=A0A2I1GGW5_9GLOM|nr:hypothetical protein RhiirA4_460563 [Rhizophagus irregularis]
MSLVFKAKNTVKDFYLKLEEYNKSFGHSEEFLKCTLLKGLSPENKIKVLMDGLQALALDEILEREQTSSDRVIFPKELKSLATRPHPLIKRRLNLGETSPPRITHMNWVEIRSKPGQAPLKPRAYRYRNQTNLIYVINSKSLLKPYCYLYYDPYSLRNSLPSSENSGSSTGYHL